VIVVQSLQARRDLEDIYRFGIQRYGAVAASAYIDEIILKYRYIANWPQSCSLRHEVSPPVRIYPFKGHLIIYRESEHQIEVLRVVAHYRDWMGSM
jgi:toxin ParE1/3/4